MKWIKTLHILISKFLMKNRSPTVLLAVGDSQLHFFLSKYSSSCCFNHLDDHKLFLKKFPSPSPYCCYSVFLRDYGGGVGSEVVGLMITIMKIQ